AALLLPNVAALSDAQCAALRAYAESGGSMLATFETSRYNEWGARRNTPGLADLFGFEVTGDLQGPNGNSYYARIEAAHPILKGFEATKVLPGAEYRLPVKSSAPLVLSVVAPYPAFPPEMVYTKTPRTTEPAVLLRERGASRLAWFPGDVDRSLWRSDNGDLSLLLRNTVNWLLNEKRPVTVTGDGMAELFAWRTEPGYAIHILNYTNPSMLRGWFRETYPIREQRVRMSLANSASVREVRALRSGKVLPHHASGDAVEFVVPEVRDYEIAAVFTR
ncbi:MAG: hypothetical protein M3Z32_13265, partial [Acidobacteriota bacterium]|nr:hypothetical protein [Acidobacteriota bacterium]